jgi:hypothetical protein
VLRFVLYRRWVFGQRDQAADPGGSTPVSYENTATEASR